MLSRPTLALSLLVLTCAAAEAQIVYVVPRDEKVAKRCSKFLTTVDGRPAVVGEPKQGIRCEPHVIHRESGGAAFNELWVGDPKDPSRVPYKMKGDRKVKNRGGRVFAFAGDDFEGPMYVDRLQTLEGVAVEYERRRAEIDAWKSAAGAKGAETPEVRAARGRLLPAVERLRSWLLNMGYPAAAKALERERKSLVKNVATDRADEAIESVTKVETPESLQQAAKEISEGEIEFGVVESRHLRLLYPESVGEKRALGAIRLGEQIIESFRQEFVDPFVDEGYRDTLPDERFMEWFFTPGDNRSFELYRVHYYGSGWGDGEYRQRALAVTGVALQEGPRNFIEYWRLLWPPDVEGIVAHTLGHALAMLHYGDGGFGVQDWLKEAVGYYASIGPLGRNSVTCFQWSKPVYAKPAGAEAEKTVQAGVRAYLKRLALAKGPPIDTLAAKRLWEINDADFAKAWSFFDFIAVRLGKDGQQWLRDTCREATYGSRADFMVRWRAATEGRFPVPEGTDVFAALEARWREYATGRQ